MSAPKYTDAVITKALRETKGQVYLAADKLGCEPATIYRRLQKSPRVKAAFDAERGRLVDTAELGLHRAVLAGEWEAIKFALKTIGKDRGYAERVEQTGKDGQDLILAVPVTVVEFVKPPEAGGAEGPD